MKEYIEREALVADVGETYQMVLRGKLVADTETLRGVLYTIKEIPAAPVDELVRAAREWDAASSDYKVLLGLDTDRLLRTPFTKKKAIMDRLDAAEAALRAALAALGGGQ